jgi:AraC family transcriptional activator of mtrCDE
MRNRTAERRRTLVQQSLRAIAADPARAWTLDELAQAIAASRRSVQRAFEGEGITYRQALSAARICLARKLFADEGGTVRSVSKRVGYASTAEFTKAFKRHAGMTPSAYRRSVRERRRQEAEEASPAFQPRVPPASLRSPVAAGA